MSIDAVNHKANRLYVFLAGFFVANALIAEFIGVKIFSLEKTIGITPFDISVLGIEHLSFNLTTGVLLWPFVFVLTDIINEYFGKKGVRMLSFLAAALITYAFVMFYFGIKIIPADFWITTKTDEGIPDMNNAFRVVFGQGLWIIIGSLTAFLIGQFVDVITFHRIKKITGEKFIWLRATGSTLVSQFLDSFVVLFIAFYIGAGWEFRLVLAIGIVNYIYKFIMAIVMTPVIYLVHAIIEKYLGEKLATELKQQAMQSN
jgi:queuosine precursor transporter